MNSIADHFLSKIRKMSRAFDGANIGVVTYSLKNNITINMSVSTIRYRMKPPLKYEAIEITGTNFKPKKID